MNRTYNARLCVGFSQVCVMHGLEWIEYHRFAPLGENNYSRFENEFKDVFGVRVQYLETIVTKPDLDEDGNPVPETGGRSDAFFAIHDDDLEKFIAIRAKCEDNIFFRTPRWIENVLCPENEQDHLYPKRVLEYCL